MVSLLPATLPAFAVFVVAARHQNFARAAGELGLTASAVSHHVRTLEGTLGIRLFQRHARGANLTNESADALRAAASGLGVVLARSRLAGASLEGGELVRLPGPALKARFGYYAVHPTHRRPNQAAAAFIQWLQQTARTSV